MSGVGCEGADKIHSIQAKVIDEIIGVENYDFSHVVLSGYNGGCAGSFKIGYSGGLDNFGEVMRHEMGHQFNAGHSCELEPKDAGKTLMCGNNEPHAHAESFHTAAETLLSSQKNAGRNVPTGNSIPTVNAGDDKAIPIGTPFTFYGVAKDPEAGNKLTYVWDQLDLGESMGLPRDNDIIGPLFTRFVPTTQSSRTFITMDSLIANRLSTKMEQLPLNPRDLNFRLTVNDNHQFNYNGKMINASGINSDDIKITVVDNGGAFKVSSQKNAEIYTGGETINVTWNVSGTNKAPINTANVAISMSLDGGKTFPIVLLKTAPNNGSAKVIMPNFNSSLCRIKIGAIDNYFFAINSQNFTIRPNISKPGIKITTPSSNLLVSEKGYTAKYTVGLYTNPKGAVKVKITAKSQAEISQYGKEFASTRILVFKDTIPQTIFVRGKNDTDIEGMHADVIEHSIYASEDSIDYNNAMLAAPVNIKISDAQIPPIIGVAFTKENSVKLPNSWVKITDIRNQTIKNISLDDGQPTSISINSSAKNCGVGGCAFEFAVYGEKPRHAQSLNSLSNVAVAQGDATFIWSGLKPNTKYRLFVFGYNMFGALEQSVTITGGSAPISFKQNCPSGVLFINHKLSSKDLLVNFAQEMVSTADGTITIQVTPDVGKELSLTALGICE